MNIAAAQAILKANISAALVSDTSKERHALTIATKAAALVVACYAGRANLTARLSIQEIATQMGATYNTARQALDRAITEGPPAVEIRGNPHRHPIVAGHHSPPIARRHSPPIAKHSPPIARGLPPNRVSLKKRRDREEKERSAADNVRKRSSSERRGDVDKAPPDVAPGPPRLNGEPTRLAAALAVFPPPARPWPRWRRPNPRRAGMSERRRFTNVSVSPSTWPRTALARFAAPTSKPVGTLTT